jgi:DNA (cytosine-5)-methyltransferase 1
MSLTLTDLFCGAGGSSLGASAVADVELVMAANHWSTAIEVHQAHFPQARHDLADISQADPRRYPRTNILLASPECTNHSQARGVSRRQQQPDLFGVFDAAAERSRATMWDVGRFAEQLHYDAIVVENVVEATQWSGWTHWLGWFTDLGYSHRVISANSMHYGVPQSRDRIYVALWRKGLQPDLEMEVTGWCQRCESWRPARQAFKAQRTVGRYRQQWVWSCVSCGREAQCVTEPAASILDWSLPCPRIGDRRKPFAAATRARILAGLERYCWVPVTTSGAGNVWERTPGMRARPLTDPLPTQQATAPPPWPPRRGSWSRPRTAADWSPSPPPTRPCAAATTAIPS